MTVSGVDEGRLARAGASIAALRRATAEVYEAIAELSEANTAAAAGHATTAGLVEELFHVDRSDARAWTVQAEKLTESVAMSGERLPARLPCTARAVVEEQVGREHVVVIERWMTRIEAVEDVHPEQVADAEERLAAAARVLAPRGVDQVGARILAHLDPDGVAPEETEPPDMALRVRRRRKGGVSFDGRFVGVLDAESFTRALEPLAQPAGPDDTRTREERLGEALLECVLDSLGPHGLTTDTLEHDAPHGHDDADHHGDRHRDGDGEGEGDGEGDVRDDAEEVASEREADESDEDESDEDGPTDDTDREDHGDHGDHDDREQAGDDRTHRGDKSGGREGDESRGREGDESDAGADAGGAAGDPFPPLFGPTAPTPAPKRPVGGKHTRSCCPMIPARTTELVITMSLEWLHAGIGHATLDDGTPLPAADARRIACEAGIIPIVLGGQSEPLDVGRLSRWVPAGMRRAVNHRDRGCTWPGCGRRPRRCHAHHVQEWLADLGPTKLDNLTLLCSYHHGLIHRTGWTVEMIDGRPWFTPPRYVDPDRTPRPGGPTPYAAG